MTTSTNIPPETSTEHPNGTAEGVSIEPHRQCENDTCSTPAAETNLVIVTSAEVNGELHHNWGVHFCSMECLTDFLNQEFPLHPNRAALDITVYKPDI